MKSRIYSILYMFVLTLVFTALVGGVKTLSQDRIRRNQEIKLQRVVLSVLGLEMDEGTSDQELATRFKERIRVVRKGKRLLYLALERAGGEDRISGIAFPVGGQGFWGPIQGIVAVDPKGESVIGLAFHKHQETPGLGGRMTEDWFQDQFQGLPLRRDTDGERFFWLVPQGTSRTPQELDAITGASQTSQAIEAFLNQELASFMENLKSKVNETRGAGD